MWEAWSEDFRPRLIVVSDLDSADEDFEDLAAQVQEMVGEDSAVVVRYLPLHDDDGGVAGLLDLLTEEVRDYSSGELALAACDLEHRLLTADSRADLVTMIATRAADDSILTRVLALMPVDLTLEFDRQFAGGEIVPLMILDGIGRSELDAMIERLSS